MKFNFTYYNPTKIHFGRKALENLEVELLNYGNNILLAYGGGSIKKIGLYDEIIVILNKIGKNIIELPGIMPNPTYEKMMEGARLAKENKVDLILAVGGGSVIDCAKGISVAAYCEGDPWKKYWEDSVPVDNPIVPVASILTMVGTGSEMNGGSVITNEEKKMKNGRIFGSDVYPRFSILDPEYTYSVSEYQMKSGIFDIMSHLMEQYFSGEDDNTSDYLIEGLLGSLIHSTEIAIKNPKDYEARSNIMWTSTMALNTMVGVSKEQDWEVHMIEHQLGAYTDCAHGMGLAAISIPYYRYIYQDGMKKFARFAVKVWNVDPNGKTDEELAKTGLDKLEAFIKNSGMITSLRELGATEEMLPLIAKSTFPGGGYKKVGAEEILEILKACY